MTPPQIQQLWPLAADLSPISDPAQVNAAELRQRADGAPWVAMVMIASLDGGAEVDGLSGGLGAPADKAVFGAMRAMADVIIVAGGTARAENYGPAVRRDKVVEARRTAGQADVARIAVLSASLDFDPAARLFERPDEPPLIFTNTQSPLERRAAIADRAELVVLDDVTPAAVVAELGTRGLSIAVLEGGPSLNGQFLAADLVDEINLSLAPLAVAGDAMRITRGHETPDPRAFELARVWHGDGILFLRYTRLVSGDQSAEA